MISMMAQRTEQIQLNSVSKNVTRIQIAFAGHGTKEKKTAG
jgi:hypothetical protein